MTECFYIRLTTCPACGSAVKLETDYHLADGRELGQELKADKEKIKAMARLNCNKCNPKTTEVKG
jgi:hypothetical protein